MLYCAYFFFFSIGIVVCIWPFFKKSNQFLWGKILRIGIVLCHILFLLFLILVKNQPSQDPQDMSVAMLWIYGFFVHIFLFLAAVIVRSVECLIRKRMVKR